MISPKYCAARGLMAFMCAATLGITAPIADLGPETSRTTDRLSSREEARNSSGVSPTQRDEKRRALLDAVESVRETLEAGAEEPEEIATLPQASVDALDDSGLFALKLPEILGGAEADPMGEGCLEEHRSLPNQGER